MGLKRCRAKRMIKERKDPLVKWPQIADFEARFQAKLTLFVQSKNSQ